MRGIKIIMIGMVVVFLLAIFPVKTAKKIKNMENQEYKIAKISYNSASIWSIIGDENGMFEEPISVELIGEDPHEFIPYGLIPSEIILYGEFQGSVTTPGGYLNQIFFVKEWDILYPVQRTVKNDILPKSWVCLMDLVI